MGTFRKKPVEVEAVRWRGEQDCPEVYAFLGYCHPDGETAHDVIHIETLEGTMTASPGDWIIRGIKGEFYPCRSDIFQATYDEVEYP